jgi:hypothetical protein
LEKRLTALTSGELGAPAWEEAFDQTSSQERGFRALITIETADIFSSMRKSFHRLY